MQLAVSDASMVPAFKLVKSLRSRCSETVSAVRDCGRVRRETREVRDRADAQRGRTSK